jgi:hypothetical protein
MARNIANRFFLQPIAATKNRGGGSETSLTCFVSYWATRAGITLPSGTRWFCQTNAPKIKKDLDK